MLSRFEVVTNTQAWREIKSDKITEDVYVGVELLMNMLGMPKSLDFDLEFFELTFEYEQKVNNLSKFTMSCAL